MKEIRYYPVVKSRSRKIKIAGTILDLPAFYFVKIVGNQLSIHTIFTGTRKRFVDTEVFEITTKYERDQFSMRPKLWRKMDPAQIVGPK